MISVLVYLMMGAALAGLFISYVSMSTKVDLSEDQLFGWSIGFVVVWPILLTVAMFYLLGKKVWK